MTMVEKRSQSFSGSEPPSSRNLKEIPEHLDPCGRTFPLHSNWQRPKSHSNQNKKLNTPKQANLEETNPQGITASQAPGSGPSDRCKARASSKYHRDKASQKPGVSAPSRAPRTSNGSYLMALKEMDNVLHRKAGNEWHMALPAIMAHEVRADQTPNNPRTCLFGGTSVAKTVHKTRNLSRVDAISLDLHVPTP